MTQLVHAAPMPAASPELKDWECLMEKVQTLPNLEIRPYHHPCGEILEASDWQGEGESAPVCPGNIYAAMYWRQRKNTTYYREGKVWMRDIAISNCLHPQESVSEPAILPVEMRPPKLESLCFQNAGRLALTYRNGSTMPNWTGRRLTVYKDDPPEVARMVFSHLNALLKGLITMPTMPKATMY